jgi:glutathione S-transferase
MTLTLHTNPMSRGRIARWALEETGAPYEVVVLGYGAPLQAPGYRALNPMAKVPTLVDGTAVITECAAIILWLAERFPAAGLSPPAGSPARAAMLRWLFFAAGPVEYAVTFHALGLDPPPERSAMVGFGSCERVFDTLEAALAGRDWIAGEAFSAADLYLGAQIGFGLRFGTVPDRPVLRAYWERMERRPARLRAEAADDALFAAATEKAATEKEG